LLFVDVILVVFAIRVLYCNIVIILLKFRKPERRN